jgi:hypothetical protein
MQNYAELMDMHAMTSYKLPYGRELTLCAKKQCLCPCTQRTSGPYKVVFLYIHDFRRRRNIASLPSPRLSLFGRKQSSTIGQVPVAWKARLCIATAALLVSYYSKCCGPNSSFQPATWSHSRAAAAEQLPPAATVAAVRKEATPSMSRCQRHPTSGAGRPTAR